MNERAEGILRALDRMEKAHGKRYCPCSKPLVDDNICPCKDLREESKCSCGLYKLRTESIIHEYQDN